MAETTKLYVAVEKKNIRHGVVFGFAITSSKDGEPYYDLNVDREGAYKGERVPEHIDDDEVMTAGIDFADSERPGNEMHKGPNVGKFLFIFPYTREVAKDMFGVDNPPITGLAVGYKPPEEVLAKFVAGEYRGFSIEGWHEDSELLDD